jgi:hypothetical protein
MAKEINKQTLLDNRFFLPPGIVDVRAAGEENGEGYYDTPDVAVEGPILSDPNSAVPMPPTSYKIVEQRVRISSDGRAVVDVYLEFPDVAGIETIDVRVTKA